jgi:hypothetical protein
MRTNDTLLLQALKLKELNTRGYSGGDLVEQLLASNPDQTKEKMRNICAFITPEMFDQVEGVCNLLSLSKRQVIEMALIDFLEKADKIVEDTGAFPGREH